MGLTGLQIFKLLPNTNCKECGQATCLAFAMKLAAGKEPLDKCPYASDEAKAALGAASAPPIRSLTIGRGDRAVTVGEETVFFRHEKTFVRKPGLFQQVSADLPAAELQARVDRWRELRIERAGETFVVDGVALAESADRETNVRAAALLAGSGLPLALLAATVEGATAMLDKCAAQRPLLVPPAGAEPAPYLALAARAGVPCALSAPDLGTLAERAAQAQKTGTTDLILEAPGRTLGELHSSLTQIRRGALERAHPGLGHPVLLRVGPGQLERAVLGIAKFASLLVLADDDGASWLPLWTLRQNIYTDPQKPLRMDAGIYPIGEPDEKAPLLCTTNFSLTYFTVATELEGVGVPAHLAVVDAEGMSVLTAWSAGKFSGDRVAKALRDMGALDKVSHHTVIIPGYVAVISGELEDALGEGWRVLTGPQEASDIGSFYREVWERL
jgi:acetyl-CoA decarbonylase/synthase, CODH/ACS complex subunit gamma